MNAWGLRALRLLRKPPGYLVRRAVRELHRELDRFAQPFRTHSFNATLLCARTGDPSLSVLWERLASQSWPVTSARVEASTLDELTPGASQVVKARAERALRHEVDLLGSGLTPLGELISWDVDFKTGARWESRYFRDIPVINVVRPSDIKVPWELSRLQWLLPVGQAYLLSGEERFAHGARAVFEQWLTANPPGNTVNWVLAMEPAMRIFSWIWLFRVFAPSPAWGDEEFRARFLCSLYQHGQFVARHIERGDINGNHFTADCAALVVAGAFFGGAEGELWLRRAFADLEREIAVQILEDGVDFEASTAYHRLVSELFLLAAVHAEHRGVAVSDRYRARLRAAARFCVAYTRADGSAPLWGDADDARALPLGTAPVNDHRHLVATTAVYLNDPLLAASADGGWDEALWLFGLRARPARGAPLRAATAQAFPAGGVYVLRSGTSHVFVDCGMVGLAGRGGHGHNDALSFEAMLEGIPVVSDPGCFVYTSSFEERNHFRGTAVHNTPQIDGEEINRFVSPQLLWLLHDDARPLSAHVLEDERVLTFEGAHSGYQRLREPIVPRRRIELCRDGTWVRVSDTFEGTGTHAVSIPLQLAPHWTVSELAERDAWYRHVGGRRMHVSWKCVGPWQVASRTGRVAPAYGVVNDAPRLVWQATHRVAELSLDIVIELVKEEIGGEGVGRQARGA